MRVFTALFLVILLFMPGFFLTGARPLQAAAPPSLPLKAADRDWRELSQRLDPRLQAKLELTVKQHHLWQSLVAEGKMGVGLVDLSDPKTPRFARLNGDTMMYAASLPKLMVLLAAFQGFEDGTLKETPELRAELVEMIRRSDNAATNKVIDRIGLKRIEGIILDPRYRFYDQRTGGGFWVGTDYGSHLVQNPEPLKNLDHAATVNQVCRFYYLLAYGRLINPKRSGQMLKILAFPDLDDKFVNALGPAVPHNRVYRKSGEWKTWSSDSMLVWGSDWRRYILVSLIEHPQGEKILKELVPATERVLRPGLPGRTFHSR